MMDLYRQHRNRNGINSLWSFILPVFPQNILSWKGSIRVIKCKSSVNGPYRDYTALVLLAPCSSPQELMWRGSSQRMEKRGQSLIILFFSLVLLFRQPFFEFTKRYHSCFWCKITDKVITWNNLKFCVFLSLEWPAVGRSPWNWIFLKDYK